jgi:membrane-associated phospholipid phosphatase
LTARKMRAKPAGRMPAQRWWFRKSLRDLDSFWSAFALHSGMACQKKTLICILLWVVASVVAVLLAWPLDGRVDAALVAPNNSSLHHFAWWCSKFGEGGVVALAGIFFTIIYMLLRRPEVAAKIFFVTLTCEITGAAADVVRVLCGRTRPLADVPQGFYGLWYQGHWIAGKYEFSSFPSGHSATAVGVAAAAWLVHRGWGAVAAIYALLVMWSRIALQCHHLSDVVASTMLAIPLAVLSQKILLPFLEFQFSRLGRREKKIDL